MTTKQKIAKELKDCLDEVIKLLKILQEYDKKADLKKDDEEENIPFQMHYQIWYTKASRIVERLAPDRLAEFKSYYEIDPKRKSIGYGTYSIQDFIKNVVPSRRSHPDFDAVEQTFTNVYNQNTILSSLVSRIDNIVNNIETSLFYELQDKELDTAQKLIKVNLRASGSLAGVILESHLQKVVQTHNLKSRKKYPSIGDFNEILKSNEIIENPTWRKISYLADLRNLCTHKKSSEPTEEQIIELINGVNWAIKMIN